MTPGEFLRDKLTHLLLLAFAVLFAAVLLRALSVAPGAIGFLCLVLVLCGVAPLCGEYARKRAFYRDAMETLAQLEEKYLLSELLQSPSFCEGVLFYRALAETNKSMNDTVSAARRDMGEYQEYIEAWVHEVKTPIASAHLLLENNRGPLASSLEEELFKIDGYVEQALFYARSGAVERDCLVKAMSLKTVVASAVKKYARPLIGGGFQIDLEQLTATVYSDPKWVEFILGQILSNAVKYRSPRPSLVFSQRIDAALVVLTVADNGAGIPAADLPRVFDKGFTGQNGRKLSARSTGLGLYLARKLCDRLALTLSLESTEGAGTQVSITFPKSKFYLAD